MSQSKFDQDTSISKNNSLEFPTEGVKLKWILDSFIPICGIDKLKGLTTLQVCNDFVKKHTCEQQSSYCRKLQNAGDDLAGVVGKPTIFVSHAFDYEFLNVVDALQNH